MNLATKTITTILLTLLIASCAARKPVSQNNHIPPEPVSAPSNLPPATSTTHSLNPARQIIVQSSVDSLYMPYQWGGHSPQTGFDCSGLVYYVYGQANLSIPRTTEKLLTLGHGIKKAQLLPGDLVFFKNPNQKKSLHVGIFIKQDFFIHAPGKGRQVTWANLDNPYFQDNYIGSRRLIQ